MPKQKWLRYQNDSRATDEDDAVNREKREKGEWRYGIWQERLMRNGKRNVTAVLQH